MEKACLRCPRCGNTGKADVWCAYVRCGVCGSELFVWDCRTDTPGEEWRRANAAFAARAYGEAAQRYYALLRAAPASAPLYDALLSALTENWSVERTPNAKRLETVARTEERLRTLSPAPDRRVAVPALTRASLWRAYWEAKACRETAEQMRGD